MIFQQRFRCKQTFLKKPMLRNLNFLFLLPTPNSSVIKSTFAPFIKSNCVKKPSKKHSSTMATPEDEQSLLRRSAVNNKIPVSCYYIISNEICERFSYYGLKVKPVLDSVVSNLCTYFVGHFNAVHDQNFELYRRYRHFLPARFCNDGICHDIVWRHIVRLCFGQI